MILQLCILLFSCTAMYHSSPIAPVINPRATMNVSSGYVQFTCTGLDSLVWKVNGISTVYQDNLPEGVKRISTLGGSSPNLTYINIHIPMESYYSTRQQLVCCSKRLDTNGPEICSDPLCTSEYLETINQATLQQKAYTATSKY